MLKLKTMREKLFKKNLLSFILAAAVFLFCINGTQINNTAPREISVENASAMNYTSETEETSNESRNLPVLMYHSLLKSRTSTYIIHPDVLEKDLIALKDAGYESVSLKQLIKFSEGKDTLPEKPILITFDDGHYNNFYYALPLFRKHGFKGVINIIGAFSEFSSTNGDASNPNYSHLTWEEIKTLNKSGIFEIGNHTYNMHKYTPRFGIMPKNGEDKELYAENLKADIGRCQEYLELKSGVNCVCFAYPFGRYNQTAEKTLKDMGFKVILTCSEKNNVIHKGDKDCLLRLNRYNRDSHYSTSELISKISKI